MNKLINTLAAATACLLSAGAQAEFYVSGAAGVGHVSFDCSGVTSCDHSAQAVKVIGGYDFGHGHGLSAEFGYQTFGKADAAIDDIGLELKADAFTLGLAYALPLNATWGMRFRLGAANVRTKITGTVAGVRIVSEDATKTAPYYGLGVDFALTSSTSFDLSADFSRGEFEDLKANVRAITFGIRQSF